MSGVYGSGIEPSKANGLTEKHKYFLWPGKLAQIIAIFSLGSFTDGVTTAHEKKKSKISCHKIQDESGDFCSHKTASYFVNEIK